MIKATKLWTSISAITLVSVSTFGLSACDTSSTKGADTEQEASQKAVTENDAPAKVMDYSMSSGGEGEGEGADSDIDLGRDDIAYLTQLGLMRGHLYVGHELYIAGQIEHAKSHMKHPKSELYAEVEPAFKVRGTSGFSTELLSISDAVEGELGSNAVSSAYATLIAAIAENEAAVEAESLAPAQKLKLVSEILRVAGEEYAIAVVDGKMQNAHEYQDALGFTTIAVAIVNEIDSGGAEINSAKASALELLASLKPHWPTLIPPETLTTKSSAIYVAAAKIELLSLGID
jgi:hypothetical protein